MTNRRLDLYALLILALVVIFVVLIGASMVRAKGYEGVGVKHARQHVREAKAELADAQRILTATRRYSREYGAAVGRWTWLARDTGWGWAQMPQLMYVVQRESRGWPTAKNPSSSASGLLQMLSGWWDGTYFGWHFDPFNPRSALRYGWKAYHDMRLGWGPWQL